MRERQIPIGVAAVMILAATSLPAQVTILSDDFESGALAQWTGQGGGPYSGIIVADPLDSSNHVLTFTAVTFGGDMFGVPPKPVDGTLQRLVLSFDFLGLPVGDTPPPEFGGFAGIATGYASGPYFLAGTYLPAVDAPPPVATQLVADGQWHHYDIDFTDLAVSNDFTSIQVVLEDFGGNGSVPGDVYFDNVRLTATLNPGLIDQLVPCSGPTPRRKWKNHGQYVSKVSKVVDMFLTAGLITEEEHDAFMSAAAKSDCGRKKPRGHR